MNVWGDEYARTVEAPPQVAPGAGVSLTVSGAVRQVLLAVSFRLVASAAVATRTPILSVSDGTGIALVQAVTPQTVTAGQTRDFSFCYGLAEWDAVTAGAASGPCPVLPLIPGDVLAVTVASMDAGDQLSRVRVTLLQVPVRAD